MLLTEHVSTAGGGRADELLDLALDLGVAGAVRAPGRAAASRTPTATS